MAKRVGVVAEFEAKSYEDSIWSSFRKHGRFSNGNRVGCIAISNGAHPKYAVPKGRSIIIYKAAHDTKKRRIGGFSKSVTTCNFRSDGKLMVGGEEGGYLRICTTDRNTYHLKKFQAHEGNVLHADFCSDGLQAVSLGGDGFAKIWDVALGEITSKYRVSKSNEPPSCMSVGKCSKLFCTGDFTGTVGLYDLREKKPVHSFVLPATPSALKLACDDGVIVAAADNCVYTWCAATGKPFLQSGIPEGSPNAETHWGTYMHYKLITDLAVVKCVDVHPEPLLVSVGMDRLLRIYSLNGFEIFHQERLASPCTALGAFPDLSHVVVGMENGLVRSFAFETPSQLLPQKGVVANASTATTSKSGAASSAPAEEEMFSVVDPESRAVAQRFSGKWRGINADAEGDRALTTEEWFKKPLPVDGGGTRIAPKDWGFQGSRAPFIHEHTEMSLAPTGASDRRRAEPSAVARVTERLLRFKHTAAFNRALRLRTRVPPQLLSADASAEATSATSALLSTVRVCAVRGTLDAAVAGRSPTHLCGLLRRLRHLIGTAPAVTAPTCLHLLRVITKTYKASDLATNAEFVKLRQLLNATSMNLRDVSQVAAQMRPLLYPGEERLQVPSETARQTDTPGGSEKEKTKALEQPPAAVEVKKRRRHSRKPSLMLEGEAADEEQSVKVEEEEQPAVEVGEDGEETSDIPKKRRRRSRRSRKQSEGDTTTIAGEDGDQPVEQVKEPQEEEEEKKQTRGTSKAKKHHQKEEKVTSEPIKKEVGEDQTVEQVEESRPDEENNRPSSRNQQKQNEREGKTASVSPPPESIDKEVCGVTKRRRTIQKHPKPHDREATPSLNGEVKEEEEKKASPVPPSEPVDEEVGGGATPSKRTRQRHSKPAKVVQRTTPSLLNGEVKEEGTSPVLASAKRRLSEETAADVDGSNSAPTTPSPKRRRRQ